MLAVALATLFVPALGSRVLKPGRDVGEVRPLLALLAVVLTLLLIAVELS